MTLSQTQTTALSRLEACLADELATVADGRRLLLAKQQALVSCELDSLIDFAEQELALASRLACLEAQRIATVADTARAFSINADEANLQVLIELLGLTPANSQVPELSRRLSADLNEVVELNYQNELLTHNMLDYTRMVVATLTTENGTPRYSSNGQVSDHAQTRAILNDVV